MYVCICNAITDTQIREAAESGVSDLWQLQAELGVATQCGSCREQASAIIRDARLALKPARPRLYVPATA